MAALKPLILQLFLVLLWRNAESSKILVVFPFPSHSHFSLGVTLAEALAEKGHEVTMINPYPDKTSPKIRDISTENIIPYVEELKKQLFTLDNKMMFAQLQNFSSMSSEMSQLVFESPDVNKLMNSKEQFDAIIIEHFMNDVQIGLGYIFKAPIILISPTDATLGGYLLGNPAPSSYVPNKLGRSTKNMNFFQRLGNFASNTMLDIVREFLMIPSQKQLFEKFITKDVPFDDVLYNVSLLLTNSHPSVTNPSPLQPNIIEIGGFHVKPPKKLPEDLQKFMDNAKDGVILFSMGSNLKSADLNPEIRDAILTAFSKIKQQVLWKFEKNLDNLPKNVKIKKWLPQNDILAHPNTRAFISHGGLLSTIETIYHGVPVIGIPIFADQKGNIASAVANGFGLSVPLSELNEENLWRALNEIVNNPKYRENAKRRSKLMHDRPLKPLDTAIYWIEYVIRNRDISEFRSSALDLKWYQLYMIDILLFLIVSIIIVLLTSCIIAKKLFALFFNKLKPNVHRSIRKKSKKE